MNKFKAVSLILIAAAVALSGCGKPAVGSGGGGGGAVINPGGSGGPGTPGGPGGAGGPGGSVTPGGGSGTPGGGSGTPGGGSGTPGGGSGTPGGGSGGPSTPGGGDSEQDKKWLEDQKNSTDPKRNAQRNHPGYRYVDPNTNKDVQNPGAGTDTDGDAVLNPTDNCPYDANADQLDGDGDGVGDACDNCPTTPNSDQRNICDPSDPSKGPWEGTEAQKQAWHREHDDTDGDGLPDHYDTCPTVRNELLPGKTPGSKNPADYDGLGTDTDGDQVPDVCDNCPDLKNKDQLDSNGNGKGDVCEGTYSGQACTTAKECIDAHAGTECTAGQCSCGSQSVDANKVKPNVILILDASGSMEDAFGSIAGRQVTRMEAMKQALNSLADVSYNDFIFSVLDFGAVLPSNQWINWTRCLERDWWGRCTRQEEGIQKCGRGGDEYTNNWLTSQPTEYSSSDDLKRVWAGVQPGCGTPTGPVLDLVTQAYQNGTFDKSNHRKTVAILLTDGEPTLPQSKAQAQRDAVAAAKRLYDAGVPLYVVGMNVDTQSLRDTASAGSGGARKDYINTQDADKLAKTIKAIANANAKCSLTLSTTSNTNQIYVKVNGRSLSRTVSNKEFTYDPTTKYLELSDSACRELNSVQNPNLEVILGCDICVIDSRLKAKGVSTPVASEKEYGLCDGVDNDCDGNIDEGCDGCGDREICDDGKDNDCDGVVDNGCAETKKKKNEECTRNSDCENPLNCLFDEAAGKKVCKAECVQIGAACGPQVAECCSGLTCASGSCTAG